MLLLIGLTLFSFILGSLFPIIGYALFAIASGIICAHTFPAIRNNKSLIRFGSKKMLQYAIILTGFHFSFQQLSKVGLTSLSVTIITITLALISAFLLGKWLHLKPNLTTLIGVGTAICGGSAIAAVSPIIDADEDDIAYAMSTIFFFNLAAIILFPSLGHLFQMSDTLFGHWAGAAINDTSSVVAAGYIYSEQAGQLATIVKLARALMIVPISLLFVVKQAKKTSIAHVFPWFILWFVLASVCNSIIPLPSFLTDILQVAAKLCMSFALVCIGLQVNVKTLVHSGTKPLLLGALLWLIVAISSLLMLTW